MAPPDDDPLTADEVQAIRVRALNVVGHELRTPMTTLRGLAEALAAASTDEVRNEIAPALLRNARRLEGLLDDVLIALGVSTTLPVGGPEPVEVGNAVRAAWSELGTGGELDVEVEGETWAHVNGAALHSALGRVLDNASKYGQPPLTVRVGTREGMVEIEVDTPGELVHPDEVRLVTEPFFRGYHAVTVAPGLGLGLTVARELVRNEGGRLEFTERPGGGAITRIILPCRADPE